MRTCIAYINLKKQKNNITDIQYTSSYKQFGLIWDSSLMLLGLTIHHQNL